MASHSHITACHECDLLVGLKDGTGNALACPRCGTVLAVHKPGSIGKTLAMTLTGLLLFVPANFLPVLRLDILGLETRHTVVSAVAALYNGGFPGVALMVLATSIAAPLACLVMLCTVLVSVRAGWYFSGLPSMFRLILKLDAWAMLDVYLISLAVAAIKLADMARLEAGLGLACFTGLMLSYAGIKACINPSDVWSAIETLQIERRRIDRLKGEA